MPLAFTLSQPDPPPTPPLDQIQELIGRDVKFTEDYQVGPHGDYVVVDKLDAARQSIEREAQAKPGDLPFFDEWGMDVAGVVYRPDSKSNRDAATNRIRERLRANPRIESVTNVVASRDAVTDAAVYSIDVVVGGTSTTTVIKGPGR